MFKTIDVFIFNFAVAPSFDKTVNATQTILLGQRSPLWCQALGAPAPVITWFKDKDVLQNSTGVIYNLTSYDDEARYNCVATNSFGRDEMMITVAAQRKT